MRPWQRVLLHLPKIGLAYRAFRWFRFVRRHGVVKLAKRARRLRRAIKRARKEYAMKGALQSKTIWGLVAMAAGFLVQVIWHVDVDEAGLTSVLQDAATWGLEAFGAALGYYGRLKATVPIRGVLPK